MALKVEELRIGNIIEVKCIASFCPDNFDPQPVNLKNLKSIKYGNDEFEYRPIPLTEEWLLKLGFGKCEEHNLSKDISDRLSITYDWHFKVLYLTTTSTYGEEQVGLTHIENVHQLQNLWFPLAGEELTPISVLQQNP